MSLPALRELLKKNAWRATADGIVRSQQHIEASTIDFATFWIESGHRVREQVSDDKLLSSMLRRLLPPYEGDDATLYRGENLERWESGTLGFAWTKDIAIARMFASGLNAVRTGGVLLEATFVAEGIISGPNAHSTYLGEGQFTVDPDLVVDVVRLEVFPPA